MHLHVIGGACVAKKYGGLDSDPAEGVCDVHAVVSTYLTSYLATNTEMYLQTSEIIMFIG